MYIDYHFWESVFPYFEYCWLTHMKPEILSNSLKNNGAIKSGIGDGLCQDHQYYITETSALTIPTTSATPDLKNTTQKNQSTHSYFFVQFVTSLVLMMQLMQRI